MICSHCKEEFANEHPIDHPDECCDCFDLHCGMPLEQLNAERAERGLGPVPPRRKP